MFRTVPRTRCPRSSSSLTIQEAMNPEAPLTQYDFSAMKLLFCPCPKIYLSETKAGDLLRALIDFHDADLLARNAAGENTWNIADNTDSMLLSGLVTAASRGEFFAARFWEGQKQLSDKEVHR